MSLESYYRSFLKTPYENAGLMFGTGYHHHHHQKGGMVTRFGSTLSGNPNINVLRGSPTGGMTGILTPKVQGPYRLGGGHRKHKSGGKMDITKEFINPSGAYFNTYPQIGSVIY